MLMLVLIAVTIANSTSESQTPYAPKTYDKMMVCNLVQDSRVNEVLTKLEAKMDNLIALVGNVCTAQPKSTGRLRQVDSVNMFSKSFVLPARYNCHQPEVFVFVFFFFFITYTAVPVSSCKELHDKNK